MTDTPDLRDLRGQIAHDIAERNAELDAHQWGYDHSFVPLGGDEESDSFAYGAADAALARLAPLLAAKDQRADVLSALLRGMARRSNAWHRLAIASQRTELELRSDVLVAGSAIGRWRERYFEMVRERDSLRKTLEDRLADVCATVERLTGERDEARAEVDKLRATEDAVMAALKGLLPAPKPTDTELDRIGDVVFAVVRMVDRLRANLTEAQERAKFFARAYDNSVRELNAFADAHEQCDVTAEEAEQDDAPSSGLAGLAARGATPLTSDEAVATIKNRYSDALSQLDDDVTVFRSGDPEPDHPGLLLLDRDMTPAVVGLYPDPSWYRQAPDQWSGPYGYKLTWAELLREHGPLRQYIRTPDVRIFGGGDYEQSGVTAECHTCGEESGASSLDDAEAWRDRHACDTPIPATPEGDAP